MSNISICPTITAFNAHEYRAQMELVEPFAQRIHIDLMDGMFAPTKSPDLAQVWWPDKLTADIHLMYKYPANYIDQLIGLKPSLVIVHAEAEGDLGAIADKLHSAGLKAGLALLQPTSVESQKELIAKVDHVLIFSGNLGYHGGSQVDFALLDKADEIKSLNPSCEVGWDGGVNDQNAVRIIKAGVEALNVGGFIHDSPAPLSAYDKLKDVTKA